jgi:hypothetical protein
MSTKLRTEWAEDVAWRWDIHTLQSENLNRENQVRDLDVDVTVVVKSIIYK